MTRHHTKLVLFALLTSLALAPRPTLGLTPPWEESELEARADLIVVGEIGAPIECVGTPEQLEIGRKDYYAVPLKIRKIFKGKARPGQTFSLRFTHIYYEPGAVGDQEADHYPGEIGRYYLQRLKEAGHARVVHWSGAMVMQAGRGSLPKCPTSSKRKT